MYYSSHERTHQMNYEGQAHRPLSPSSSSSGYTATSGNQMMSSNSSLSNRKMMRRSTSDGNYIQQQQQQFQTPPPSPYNNNHYGQHQQQQYNSNNGSGGYNGNDNFNNNNNSNHQRQQNNNLSKNGSSHRRRSSIGGGLDGKTISYYFEPRHRLNTLFAIHAIMSLFIGIFGYIRPRTANIFFSIESKREYIVARSILRLYCSLIFAQGIMIWKARAINDGAIKRAFVQAYFFCFLFSSLALIFEHTSNKGVVSGQFFGIIKIITMFLLTLCYGWFTFLQPPEVFTGLGTYKRFSYPR